ncbi:flagellar motor protein MotB [Pseudorhodoferax sp. Leaf274]|uniref:flagellar motor protein MotB n=1 Tax=Pseudorhodoferax sp. Leaf274 TaxID=1736318 RepID=UPI000702C18B|nr:flagellar motor protein MotB [Pseudorhodoferax sp. Leaf274]KQP45018.1 flagellar motor protein MotB [Pseudorhodoferax sp. Leaf274]
MAGDAKKLQPIIVKKIKKSGHAAHGGAWKIAYADFVTAMMAFFLLMWLLGSTSEGDRKGLSDYFNAPLKVALQGGTGAGASNSILPGGGKDLTERVGQAARGQADDAVKRKMAAQQAAQQVKADAARQDARRIADLRARIEALITNTPKLNEYRSQIRLETTPDGLQIQIVDDQNRPMFDSGSALVKPYMRDILREIGTALNDVENRLSLAGHTDATPYGNGERGYSNWELSADRANASRRELVAAGMPDAKLGRVVGLAASSPLEPATPNAPVNRRITLTVLTREAEERLMGTPPAGDATIASPALSQNAPLSETGLRPMTKGTPP